LLKHKHDVARTTFDTMTLDTVTLDAVTLDTVRVCAPGPLPPLLSPGLLPHELAMHCDRTAAA
jgi:hypothetical protein